MSSYRSELRAVAEQLDLPHPMRARVILELASDLAGLEAELVASGVTPAQARDRAIQTLIPSAGPLRELRDIHRPLYRRLVDRFSDPVRHRLERLALALISVALCSIGLARLAGSGFLTDPAPLSALLLAVGLMVVVVSVWKTFALRVRREHELAGLRSGMWLLPAAATVSAVLALGGSAVDLYAVAGLLEADLTAQGMELVRWLRRDAGLLSAGLLVSSIALGLWLLIEAGIARVEQAEAEMMAGIETDAYAGNTRI
jgi:hypothetical protein